MAAYSIARIPRMCAVAVSALVLLTHAAEATAQQLDIRWQFSEGQALVYEMVQTSTTGMPGGMGETEQTQTIRYRQQVDELLDDGSARLTVTYEGVRMEMTGPTGPMSYDSDDPDAGDAAEDSEFAFLGSLVGESATVRVQPDGRVLEVEGMEEMMERLTGEMDPQVQAMMEQTFSDESMAETMQQSFMMMPEGSVGPGDSWDSEFSVTLPFGTITSNYTQTLQEVVNEGGSRVAVIRVEGTMGELVTDPESPMAGMLQMDGGPVEGQIRFDVDRGVLLSSEVENTMDMNAMGQQMSSVSTTSVRLVES